MASQSTVSIKPFASKRCFLVYQENLVVELCYGSRTDLENWVAFPKATEVGNSLRRFIDRKFKDLV